MKIIIKSYFCIMSYIKLLFYKRVHRNDKNCIWIRMFQHIQKKFGKYYTYICTKIIEIHSRNSFTVYSSQIQRQLVVTSPCFILIDIVDKSIETIKQLIRIVQFNDIIFYKNIYKRFKKFIYIGVKVHMYHLCRSNIFKLINWIKKRFSTSISMTIV